MKKHYQLMLAHIVYLLIKETTPAELLKVPICRTNSRRGIMLLPMGYFSMHNEILQGGQK